METSMEYRPSPAAVALPILASFSIVLAIPPFIWHLKNRNIAACSLIFWITLANLFVFLNALIWPTDAIETWWSGAGLCDIQVKLTHAFSVGAAGSLACIMRNLAKVMDVNNQIIRSTPAQRRRQAIVDLLWCYACPVFVMAIDYIVQPSRYYIYAVAGCIPSTDNSWLSVILLLIWAPLFCVAESYYCVLVLIRLHKYRQQFAQILSSAGSNMNKARFLRLFIMALTLLIVTLPIQFYILYTNLRIPHHPYSWSFVHGPDWSTIIMVPTGGQVPFDRWIRVACGFLVFLFFGTGHEAVEMYHRWLGRVRKLPLLRDLDRPRKRKTSLPTFGTSKVSSFGTRAALLFKRGRGATDTVSSMRRNSMITSVNDISFNDTSLSELEKGTDDFSQPSIRHERPLPVVHVDPRPWRPLDLTTGGAAGIDDLSLSTFSMDNEVDQQPRQHREGTSKPSSD